MTRRTRAVSLQTLSCSGKERYNTFARASKVASRRAHKGAALGAYRCQWCGRYHVGNTSGQDKASGKHIDPRQRYLVFATGPNGREHMIGYSSEDSGGAVAQRVIHTAGWTVSRIIERRRAA